MREITQIEALIIPHVLREPNSIIVLLFIHVFANLSREEAGHLNFSAFGISCIN